MTEYKIIEEKFSNSDTIKTIAADVQKSIRNGWQPVGDLCLSIFSYSDGSGTTRIAQAMIKKEGNIKDYIVIHGYADISTHTLVENCLLKGYELYGNLQSVGLGRYYQVLIKRIQLIADIL